MHLARGRQLFQNVGTASSPGAVSTHAFWLYDVACYALYSTVGGSGLVLFKSLLVVALALCLLQLSRLSAGWGTAAVCTALAILAMSLRLLLQPATVSYFLLALTLSIVWQKENIAEGKSADLRGTRFFLGHGFSLFILVASFVLWANADSGFVLGLATVALVWLGRIVDFGWSAKGARTASAVMLMPSYLLSMALLAGICLLNPLHVHAFALPPELDSLLRTSSPERILAPSTDMSPFALAYLSDVWRSPAGLAYYPLLGLGLLSFLLNLPIWRWERFLPWAGLAGLSAVSAKTIPFFAVVGAPALAWNLQEFFAPHAESDRAEGQSWNRAMFTLRAVMVVLGLVFLLCAWPGWLQSPPFEPRRWAMEPAPSLVEGARAVQRWHEENRLAEGARGLHLSAASASAFAWFCPSEPAEHDDSLAASVLGVVGAATDGAERMRSVGINHVIVYDTDRTRLFAILNRFLADPQQWPLLDIEGDLAVFGWRDPVLQGSAVEGKELPPPLDLNQIAYHPRTDKLAPRERPVSAYAAQRDWLEPFWEVFGRKDKQALSERLASAFEQRRRWWEVFWKPAPPRTIDRDEATSYLFYAEALKRSSLGRHLQGWEAVQSAGLVAGIGASPVGSAAGALVEADVRLTLLRPPIPERGGNNDIYSPLGMMTMQMWQPRFAQMNDDTPPALLYVAVRAARRAVAANPEDPHAYLILGDAYLRLLHDTREREWAERLPQLLQLRRVQASTALNRAIALKPDLAQAYLKLGGLYQEIGYRDLAIEQLRTYLRLTQEAGQPVGLSADAFREQQSQFEADLERLGKSVSEAEDAYSQEAHHMRVVDRAAVAMRHGLAGKSLGLLLDTDVSNFGPDGMAMELEMLLNTGQAEEVLEWSEPEHETALGRSLYHSMRVQALASVGDYDGAQEEAKLALGRRPEETPLRDAMGFLIGGAVLAETPTAEALPGWLWRVFPMIQVSAGVSDLAGKIRQEADFAVLRGVMHLEQGNVDEADTLFRLALDNFKDERSALDGSGIDFSGRIVAQTCVEWLK
jgi:tetratricopeptide (TPR) repeat protein